MKKLLILVAMLSQASFGFNAIVNCASATLATVYSTSAPSLQPNLTGLYLRATPTLMIANATASRICANTISQSTVTPTAANGNEHCVPANSIDFFDVINIPRGPANIYLRADQASCTTAIIDVDIY